MCYVCVCVFISPQLKAPYVVHASSVWLLAFLIGGERREETALFAAAGPFILLLMVLKADPSLAGEPKLLTFMPSLSGDPGPNLVI